MTCFTCTDSVELFGEMYDGAGAYWSILFLVTVLQFFENYRRVRRNQTVRELSRLQRGSAMRTPKILLATALESIGMIMWVISVLIMVGNNLWMFVGMVLGNTFGMFFATLTMPRDDTRVLALLMSELEQGQAERGKLRQLLNRVR